MKKIIQMVFMLMIILSLLSLVSCGKTCNHEMKSYMIYDINMYVYPVNTGWTTKDVNTVYFFTYRDADGYVRSGTGSFNEQNVTIGTLNSYEVCDCGKYCEITLTSATLQNMNIVSK